MSVFTACTSAVMAALAGAAPLISRVRTRPLPASAANGIVVRPGRAEVVDLALAPGMPTGWRMVIDVECYQRVTAGANPDEAVDALTSSVYARLMADPTLGGTAFAIEPQSIDPDFDTDGESVVCAVMTFSILMRSQGATL